MNYPNDIKPLTGLRFFAAFWLLCYFFWQRIDLNLGIRPNIIANGNYGVDLFFILSGFVLAHVYGPNVEKDDFTFRGFMWARLARVYPLHIVTFAIMFMIWLVGSRLGQPIQEKAFDTSQIPFHLSLTHAWGFLKSDGWNFPSWSISAEWFAYLTFPLTFAVVDCFGKRPLLGLALVVAMFYTASFFFASYGVEYTDMTWQGGALRIIPSFMAGMMLWQIGRRGLFNPKFARPVFVFAIIALLIVTIDGVHPHFVWPLLLAIVFLLAESSKTKGQEVIATKTFVYLGEISFAMYMIHLPVDIVTSRIVGYLMPQLDAQFHGFISFGFGIINTFIGAAILNAIVEKPMRDFMRERIKFKARPKNIYANAKFG